MTKLHNGPEVVFVEFGGDPSNDKECYKRYSSTEPFEACGLDAEVIRFVNHKSYLSHTEQLNALIRMANDTVAMIEKQNEELRYLVLELFSQGATGPDGKYCHSFISTYEYAQRKLIEWGMIKQKDCYYR